MGAYIVDAYVTQNNALYTSRMNEMIGELGVYSSTYKAIVAIQGEALLLRAQQGRKAFEEFVSRRASQACATAMSEANTRSPVAPATTALTTLKATVTCENPNGLTGVATKGTPRFLQTEKGKPCPAGYYSQETHQSCITIHPQEPAKYVMVEHGRPCPAGYESVGQPGTPSLPE